MALCMKYFVLKPSGDSPYSVASRAALLAYSESIRVHDADMADSLLNWAEVERDTVIADKAKKERNSGFDTLPDDFELGDW